MSKRVKVVIPLCALLAVVCGGALWMTMKFSVSGQQPSRVGDTTDTSLANVTDTDAKAKAVAEAQAKHTDIEKPVREFADATFKEFGVVPNDSAEQSPIHAAVRSEIDNAKERLVQAEINYRNGKSEGVSEENVVIVVNNLAKRFKAPGYVRTDVNEVRDLRTTILLFSPHLVTRKPKSKGEKGSSISPTMSPLEAAHLTMSMVQQKLSNDEYQVTYEERVARKQAKGKEKAAEQEPQQPYVEPETKRQREMSDVVDKALKSMNPLEKRDLMRNSLDVLLSPVHKNKEATK